MVNDSDALQTAMAVKYKLDVAEQMLKKGKAHLNKATDKLADKLFEEYKFSDPLLQVCKAVDVVQETQVGGPFTQYLLICNQFNLLGKFQALMPFYIEARDITTLEFESLDKVLGYVKDCIEEESSARSEFHAVIRELNARANIQVASVEEAEFVKEHTSLNIAYSPRLTPQEIMKIRAAIQ